MAIRSASNWIVTSLSSVALLIERTPSAAREPCSGQRQLERQGRDETGLGAALRHADERNQASKQFRDFGGRFGHDRKVAPQFFRNSGSRRFDDSSAWR
jgi:hypothetical protein